MPFLVTEPQKIEGTQLGFSVYPYHFTFQDKVEKLRKYNQKLVIFKMKESPFIETERVLFELKYFDNEVPRNYVDKVLENFIDKNPQYIKDEVKMKKFFDREADKEVMAKEIKP